MASVARFAAHVCLMLWELPQTVLGALLLLTQLPRHRRVELLHGRVFVEVRHFGISLGKFVYWSPLFDDPARARPSNKAHEYGHCIQSIIFGPLYLLLIGIPSVSRGAYVVLHYRLKRKRWTHYYDGYPEDWADRLGAEHFGRQTWLGR